MPTVAVIPRDVPFAATRAALKALDVDGQCHQLRFVWHTPVPQNGLALQLKSQLRYRSVTRCLVDVRGYAAMLAATGAHLSIDVFGPVHESDLLILGELGARGLLTATVHGSAATGDLPPSDEQTNAAQSDADWIDEHLSATGDWAQLRTRVARYVRSGDSWTSRWLLERALRQPGTPTAETLDLCGLVYQLQEMPERAAFFYQQVLETGGRPAVSAANSIAMLYARHLPPALRDLARADTYLDLSLDLIDSLPNTSDTALDWALNANSKAYLRLLAQQHTDAVTISRTALESLPDTAKDTQAHAVLANNLGRLLARTEPDNPQIEALLRQAVEIEPAHPEFRLDLALALVARQQLGQALEEATTASRLTDAVAEIPALRAYLLNQTGQHAAAAEEYLRALTVDPQQVHYLVDACRSAAAAEDYPRVVELASSMDLSHADHGAQAVLAVLALEARSFVDDLSLLQLHTELQRLHARYPGSPEVEQSLHLVSEQVA